MADIIERIKAVFDGSDVERGADKMGQSFTGSMIKSQLAVQAFNMALSEIGEQISAGIDMVLEYERTNTALESALRASGNEVENNAKALNAQSAELESIAGISDEVIRRMQAMALNTGVSTRDVDKFTRAAISMSNTMGVDVNSAMRQLTKSMSGMKGELGELVPGVSELTKEQLQAGGAVDLVNKLWGENLDLLNQGMAGQINQLSISWDNFRESAALAAAESDTLQRGVEGLSIAVEEMAATITEGGFVAAVGDFFSIAFTGGEDVIAMREQRKRIEAMRKEAETMRKENAKLAEEQRLNTEIAIGLGVDFAGTSGLFAEEPEQVISAEKKNKKKPVAKGDIPKPEFGTGGIFDFETQVGRETANAAALLETSIDELRELVAVGFDPDTELAIFGDAGDGALDAVEANVVRLSEIDIEQIDPTARLALFGDNGDGAVVDVQANMESFVKLLEEQERRKQEVVAMRAEQASAVEDSIASMREEQLEYQLEISRQQFEEERAIEEARTKFFEEQAAERVRIAQEEAQIRQQMLMDMASQGIGIASDFANTMVAGAVQMAEGSAVAFDQLAKDFLKSTGMRLIGEGIATGLQGVARIIASYGADPSGYAMVAHGGAMIGAGVPMLAGGLAIKTASAPSASGGGGGGGGASRGGGGGAPVGGIAGMAQTAAESSLPGTVIQPTFFVVGELTEQQVITINRGLQAQAAKGF